MSATGILHAANVVFYHPLDNFAEYTQAQTWTGAGGFTTGKIGNANSAVAAGAPGFGAAVVPDASHNLPAVKPNSMAPLDASRVLVTYREGGAAGAFTGKAKALVATVSGTSVTVGAVLQLDAASYVGVGECPAVAHLGGGVAVAFYNGAAGAMWARVLTVSGTDITKGAALTVDAASPCEGSTRIEALDSTTALATWAFYAGASPDRDGRMAVLKASGATLTKGPTVAFATDSVGVPNSAIGALSATKAVVAWTQPAAGADAKAFVATISGLDVTAGAVYTLATGAGTGSNTCTDLAVLTSSKFIFMYRNTAALSSGPHVTVCDVAGDVITSGPSVAAWSAASGTPLAAIYRLDSSSALIFKAPVTGAPNGVRKVTVSGLVPTFSSTTASNISFAGAPSADCVALSSTTFLVAAADESTNKLELDAGAYSGEADMVAPTPAAYPSAVGATRVVAAMWAKNLTGGAGGSSTVTVKRGYSLAMAPTSITLGGTTAVWNDAGIASLMSTMNDGSSHLLVMDFENTSGTNWNLRTSIDGAAWTDQGAQDSGTQVVATTDTAPELAITGGAIGTQWIDELVLWVGDKSSFAAFKTEELANLHDLADVFGDPMDQYEEDFGAPICWQATARMPDGSVWRDSGCGPCPPVVRVPRGASDVVVTDDGMPASPRVVEG